MWNTNSLIEDTVESTRVSVTCIGNPAYDVLPLEMHALGDQVVDEMSDFLSMAVRMPCQVGT